MNKLHQYPIICTDRLVETVNFYEDHFDFIPEMELDNYFLLRHNIDKDRYIAFVDVNSEALPNEAKKVSVGLVIKFPVSNVDTAYQQAYWEGLDILDEPKPSRCGGRQFMIRDPNGVYLYLVEDEKVKTSELVAA